VKTIEIGLILVSILPIFLEPKLGTKKTVLASAHVFVTGLLVILLTPIGGMPLFNMANFIANFGPLVYLLLVAMIPLFILIAGASYTSKRGLEGVKEGFDKAFIRVPWSFVGFIFAMATSLGVYSQPSYGQAMGAESPPMLLGISVFIIVFVISLSYVVIVWGFWGD